MDILWSVVCNGVVNLGGVIPILTTLFETVFFLNFTLSWLGQERQLKREDMLSYLSLRFWRRTQAIIQCWLNIILSPNPGWVVWYLYLLVYILCECGPCQ
jgi:apolipoprotein N-acyltransferase